MLVRKILVPVDFSSHSNAALELAIDFAKSFEASITLLHCYQLSPSGGSPYGIVMPPEYCEKIREAAERYLKKWCEKAAAAGIEVDYSSSSANPAQEILRRAEEIGADLIVMGTNGLTGISHLMIGSIAERTLRLAPCPVMTIRADA
jgi:nucleotide-binding universal stress UspA family protein